MRQKILIANWKMNGDFISIKKFFNGISDFEEIKVMVAPSYLGIVPCIGLAHNKQMEVIAQNVCLPTIGNHTGSISWIELKDYGVKTCFIGHPDVKIDYQEKSYHVNAKLTKLIKNDIKPIVFIEENKIDIAKENTKAYLKLQIDQIFDGIEGLDLVDKVYIVYKPTFDIEANSTFDKEFVFNTFKTLREFLRDKFGYYVANNLPLIYGGEIINDDIEDICKSNDIDGVLIEDERALSSKYFTILYKHLFNGSTMAYKQYYENNVLIDLPSEEQRVRQAVKKSEFDIYDTTTDKYFEDIKIVEEDF